MFCLLMYRQYGITDSVSLAIVSMLLKPWAKVRKKKVTA